MARRHPAVERRRHFGVAEIDRRLLGVRLRLLQIRAPAVARRLRLIQNCLRGELLAGEFGLALVFGLRLLQRRLGAGLRRLRREKLQAIRFGLDGEQQGVLLHEIAVGVADLLNEALHARHQIDRIDRRRVAGGVEIAGNVPLGGRRDGDLGRRRRRVLIAVAAAGDSERRDQQKDCGG